MRLPEFPNSNRNDLLTFLVGLLFAVPFSFRVSLGSLSLVIDHLDIGLIVLGLLWCKLKLHKKVKFRKTHFLIIIILFLCILSNLSNFSFKIDNYTIWQSLRNSRLFIILFLMLSIVPNYKSLFKGLWLGFGIQIGFSLLQTSASAPYVFFQQLYQYSARDIDAMLGISRHYVPNTGIVRMHGTFLFHNIFAASLSLGILSFIMFYPANSKKKSFFIILGIMVLLFTFSRGTIVAFGLAISYYLFRLKKFGRIVFVGIFLFCTVFILSYYVTILPERLLSIINPTKQSEFQSRVLRWETALYFIEQIPLIGQGRGELLMLDKNYYVTPHNILLSFIVWYGIISAFIFFSMIFYLLIIKKTKGFERTAKVTFFISIFVSGAIESLLLEPDFIGVFAIIVAFLSSFSVASNNQNNEISYYHQ